MTGIGMMLKAFGVNVTDEHIKMVETLIPELPGKIAEVYKTIDVALALFDKRLSDIENKLTKLSENETVMINIMTEFSQTQGSMIHTLGLIQERIPNGQSGSSDSKHQPSRKRVNGAS